MINVSEYALRLSTVLAMCERFPDGCLTYLIVYTSGSISGSGYSWAERACALGVRCASASCVRTKLTPARRRPLIADSHAVSAFSTRRMCSWHPFCSGLPGWICS